MKKSLLTKVVALAAAFSMVATSSAWLSTVYADDDPNNKIWLNVDFDDDKTEVISSIDGERAADKIGFKTALENNTNPDMIGAINNQLGSDKSAAAHGAEIVEGAPGRGENDKSLKLTLPRGGAQLNYEWRHMSAPISTNTSDFVIEFSIMLPSASSDVQIASSLFCYALKSDKSGYSGRTFTYGLDATVDDLIGPDGASVADKWKKITYHFTKFATFTDDTEQSRNKDGEVDIYVDGEYVKTVNHDVPNITCFQFRMIASGSGNPAVIYIDNIKMYTTTTVSSLAEPVFAGICTADHDTNVISYSKSSATVNELFDSITNIEDFNDGENIHFFNAAGVDITDNVSKLSDIAEVVFSNGVYTRTYTLSKVVSPDDKMWFNVDFDDDTPAVLSTKGTSTAADSSNAYINAIMTGNVGSASHNNKLATDNSSASFGTEIVSGAPGRAPGDNSLKLTLPAGGEQLNFEWTYNSKAISTSTSDFVFDFSVMIPSGSRVQIQPNLFYNAADADITGGGTRKWGISNIAVDTNNKITYNNTDITGKWTRIAYHITKWATVTNGALTADSGKYDVYVDGVKIAEDLSHSMPNIERLQFSLKVPAGNDANIYIDDIKMYTCKEDTPYFLDASKIAANYTDAEKYNLVEYNSKLTLSIDSANETVANARSVFGIQSVLASDGTVKADTATIARGSDKVTLKSKEGNIIYYYPTITSYMLVQGLPIYKTKDADTGKDKYTFGDRLQNLTKNDVLMRGYLAAYDSDGRLINCVPLTNGQGTTVLGAGANGGGVSFGTSKQSLVAENAETVRAYVWNANTYAPLVTAVTAVEEKTAE